MNYLKRIIYLIAIIGIFISCKDDFLQRVPQDEVTPESFFETESQLETYTNSFYSAVPNEFDIWQEWADNAADFSPSDRIKGTRTVPTTGGGWNWGQLRDINFFIAHLNQFDGPKNIRNNYEGVARFFRAWFYFKKVKRFGDVPWYSKVIAPDDNEALHKSRDSRINVMDSILVDINFAIDNLSNQKNIAKVTKWTALALKSRIYLFEGT